MEEEENPPPTHTPSFPTPLEIETAPSQRPIISICFLRKEDAFFFYFLKEIMANINTPLQLTLQYVDLLGRCEI